MAEFRTIRNTDTPRLSIIIPTRDADRNGLLDKLLEDLKAQTLSDWEAIIIIGDKRQGRAINNGVKQAAADIFATMDDDTVLGDTHTLQQCYDELVADDTIGMIGAACEIPPDATLFMRRAMTQIPRRFFPVQAETIDSDMVQHPLMVMRKSVFLEIGGEDEELIRGLDPDLRYKTRSGGYRVCIAKDAYIYHLLPDSMWGLLKMYFRNGRGSAFARKHYPEKIQELTDGHQRNQFQTKRSLPYRVCRRCLLLLKGLVTLNFIRFLTDIAYGAGYVHETFIGGSK